MRLFERRHGQKAGPELDDAAVREIAAVHARLCLALRSFFHPAAGREDKTTAVGERVDRAAHLPPDAREGGAGRARGQAAEAQRGERERQP